jgi:hypothetical protein
MGPVEMVSKLNLWKARYSTHGGILRCRLGFFKLEHVYTLAPKCWRHLLDSVLEFCSILLTYSYIRALIIGGMCGGVEQMVFVCSFAM